MALLLLDGVVCVLVAVLTERIDYITSILVSELMVTGYVTTSDALMRNVVSNSHYSSQVMILNSWVENLMSSGLSQLVSSS